MGKLEAYGCLRSMPRINHGCVRELCEFTETADNLEHAATGKIGSANTSFKQCVASEEDVFFCTIEAY